MRRRSLFAVAGWLATAVIATLIGVAAIRWVAESIAGTPGGVLSQEEVERALASSPPSTAGAGGSPSPGTAGPAASPGAIGPGTTGTAASPGMTGTAASPGPAGTSAVPGASGTATSGPAGAGPAGQRRAFATTGGSAVAECRPDGAWLVSWTPSPGYQARDVERGPDDDVEVTFVGPAGGIDLKVRCVGSEPVSVEDDD